MNIWIVDDDDINNFVCERFLKNRQEVRTVKSILSAEEALDLLEQGPEPAPHLIILDVNMPTLNAWEFLPHFRNLMAPVSKDRQPAIVLLTSSLNEDDRTKAEEAEEIIGFLPKPITSEIIDRIFNEFHGAQTRSES